MLIRREARISMAFVDEIILKLKAGDGGDGVVRWRHEKGKEFSGPSGGNGGEGGDVYLRGVRDINALERFRGKTSLRAGNGESGKKNSMHGYAGEDFYVDVPIGSVVTNTKTKEEVQVLKEGEEILLLNGGHGGLGNEHFKSSRNTTPKESTPGKLGEKGKFFIELNLMVDVGFVGLPNAGKSSLLNALTNARARVGSYQFTTLDPNLGDLYGFIIADIPGLIEGAATGKGLGHKFLRHIKRTKLLLHLISLEHKDPLDIYKTIRNELGEFDKSLVDKEEVIVLTKSDVIDKESISRIRAEIEQTGRQVWVVSVLSDESVKALSNNLTRLLGDRK